MPYRFAYHSVSEWAPLAWLARLAPRSPVVELWHGTSVETTDEWCCEAAWDGPFPAGGFDETDIVAGSGVRLRPDAVRFVSSGSTVDRLQMLEHAGAVWVSNSLVCLLSQTGLSPRLTFGRYASVFNSVIRGIERYQRRLPLDGGSAELVYFHDLEWRGSRIERVAKPLGGRAFRDFAQYLGFMDGNFERLAANMADPARRRRYTLLGTLSTGYDSTAITALARPHGLSEVLCFERGSARDVGTPNAARLGVRPIPVDISAWEATKLPEVPFIAADGFGEEVHYLGLGDRLAGRVLLTGYHGDKVWDRDTPYLSPALIRGDISGLSLTEYRLRIGFINCAVPFWGARQIEDINRISRSDEMRAWDVGGDYTRPICRRIAESAGVPREAFGITKSFASRWITFAAPITSGSTHDFLAFLRERRGAFLRGGVVPPDLSRPMDETVLKAAFHAAGALSRVPGYFRLGLNHWPGLAEITALHGPNPPHSPFLPGWRKYLFQWAMSHAVSAFRRVV